VLKTSRALGVIQLLLRYLGDATVGQGLLQIIAGRKDQRFVKRLLSQLRPKPSLSVLANMGRCKQVAWLESVELLLPLDGPQQATALELAVASGIDRTIVFRLAEELLQHGQPEARTASCLALGTHFNAEANQLLIQAFKDSDPSVVATAAKQLRQRRIPMTLERVVDHLNAQGEERAKSHEVADNVRFERYSKCFDRLDQPTRQNVGEMVLRSDPAAIDGLKTMLASELPKTIQQAIDMAAAMGAAFQVSGQLFKLLDHKDADVRRLAARALLARRSSDRSAARPSIPWRAAS
jgi:HEAT repeat protein